MWVLLVGNPIEGFEVNGPFASHTDAEYYGDHNMDDNLEWWIFEVKGVNWVPIDQPSEDTKPRTLPNIEHLEHDHDTD